MLSASPFWIFWICKPLVCIVGGKGLRGGFEIGKCQLCDSSAALGRKEYREWRNVSRRVELQGIGWCNITSRNALFSYCADQKGEPRYARYKKKKDDSLASINQGPGGERAEIPRTKVAWQALLNIG